ncbi:DNA replication and repair protein RecF [Fusobacterium sp.]|uniref:DNA replication/repair protein RecF n=1 Tax=Fusobacterium sp. TaxID=68766 RepID=UPI0025C6D677|nr:DNA replication and repair protein RecF [Fusobacterium sp.]MCI5725369.1 DNA replication and repair protein RecF [Fusobacterium sp.]
MKILNIKFFNFRNLENTSINLSSRINVFYGKNAQGKTSILEAIYFNSTGISFRTRKSSEIIKYNENSILSNIEYEDNITRNNIAVRYENILNSKKEFFFNKKKINQTDFYGKVNVIAYIPEDIILINGSPKNRRDFLDIEISQIDRGYLENLKNYNRILKIRNKYLKENLVKNPEYEIYEQEFIKYGARIIYSRIEYIKSLSIMLNLLYRKLFNSEQELSIKYENSSYKLSKLKIEDIEEELKKELIEKKFREMKYKFSLVGPHKDDFKFLLNNYEVKVNASQGEKKSIIFALKLSEIDIVKKNKKENPIIIIDDITSYFDEERRTSILEYLHKKDIQVLISSTDKLKIDSQNFYIKKGGVFVDKS